MNKLKSSVRCFYGDSRQPEEDRTSPSPPSTSPNSHRAWLKSTANQLPDQLLGRCRYLMARVGHARTPSSLDFSYDPSSYALNFDDDSRIHDELPLRYFAASSPTAGFSSKKLM